MRSSLGTRRESYGRTFHDPFVMFAYLAAITERIKFATGILIWLGGSSEAAYDRAARLADGFMFIGGDINHTIDVWKRLRDRVRSLGRSARSSARSMWCVRRAPRAISWPRSMPGRRQAEPTCP
jgi:alkanesulfonate monooxygenase SsuD/methylene tetrahydromethanopterin reductase-like flavin-dependent oxidoreductase (luciferase family)